MQPEVKRRVRAPCNATKYVLVVNLDGLDFEVERNERENETLGKRLSDAQRGDVDTCLQILHQIVEDTKSFWVLTVLDVNQGPNFCSLTNS